MFDAIVVGCGFSGAVCARKLAEEKGRRVLLLEKRSHIAGNMFDGKDTNGVVIHQYGPHIFHTHSRKVFDYLSRFTGFIPYEHRVLGHIDGKLVPIPFNFTSLEGLLGSEEAAAMEKKLTACFPGESKVSVLDLLSYEDAQIQAFGRLVFDKVFVNYTAKQWGVPAEQVDRSTINRVPVVLGRDDRYFSDPIQQMPEAGYTPLFEKLLNHENITLALSCDAVPRFAFDFETGVLSFDGARFDGPVVYTGAIDELFGWRFGPLPYRSLDLAFERLETTHFQPACVVNYPNEEAFTRITEFKYLLGQQIDGHTTILREYPLPYDRSASRGNIPYYPIANPENQRLYARYSDCAKPFSQLHFCGRLAEYRYYNMDAAVDRALTLSDSL